jgi:hypothetical protein
MMHFIDLEIISSDFETSAKIQQGPRLLDCEQEFNFYSIGYFQLDIGHIIF